MAFFTGSTTDPPAGRRVVFHADDFGVSPAVNRGILRAFREGLLTGTSLLVNAPATEQAVIDWEQLIQDFENGELPSRSNRELLGDTGHEFELGLHLNLTQGLPLTRDFPKALRARSGEFLPIGRLYSVLAFSGRRFHAALVREIAAQMRWMSDRGIRFTHLNGHQYVEMIPTVTRAVCEALAATDCRHVRYPLERCGSLLGTIKRWHAIRYRTAMRQNGFDGVANYRGTMHAGRITLQTVQTWLTALPAQASVEIGCHPGENDDLADGMWSDPISSGRPLELRWLCSPELPRFLAGHAIGLGRINPSQPTSRSRQSCRPLTV